MTSLEPKIKKSRTCCKFEIELPILPPPPSFYTQKYVAWIEGGDEGLGTARG